MKTYQILTKIYLPQKCQDIAFNSLRLAGESELESVALFVGIIDETSFFIQQTLIPIHTSYREDNELFFTIEPEELYRINVLLHQSKLKMIAQIHSHPGEAYHSTADDKYAVVTKVGALSIVVPNFAFGQIELENCAVFRLSEQNEWILLTKLEVNNLITIV